MVLERSRVLLGASLLGLLALTSGCSSTPDDGDDDAEEISAADANAALEINPLDIWAQPIPQGDLQLSVTLNGKRVRATDYPVARVYLRDAGRYTIHVAAPLHEATDVVVDYDGTTNALAARLAGAPTANAGASVGHTMRTLEGKSMPLHSVFIGVQHQFFSSQGRPARRGNNLKLMMDGEEAWGTVRGDVQGARKSIHATTWWWEYGAEWVRKDPNATVDQKWGNTVLGTLESSPATKRVMVGQFWGQDSILSWLNTDSKIRAYASRGNDNFEFMGQANETRGSFDWKVADFSFGERVRALHPEIRDERFDNEGPVVSSVPGHHVDLSAHMPVLQDFADGLLEAASYHQKFMILDEKLAFVGGMNLRQNDWDSSQHQVFDVRRMAPDASASNKLAVINKTRQPDNPPRKDYMVRIDGPAAQDVEDVFHERWEFLRKSGVKHSEYASGYDVKRDIAPVAGGTQLQVTATLPAPFNENAIAETWFNAVRHATKYIYIEDQYFRIPMLDEAIVKRMQEVPDLKLIVITMDVSKTDPACSWSRKEYGMYRQQFPDRAYFFRLRAFDGSAGDPSLAYADIDTHSKMLIVDDVFMSVGSANKNNRGIVYEGELNVAIADTAFVGPARKRILSNILGIGQGQVAPESWISAMVDQARANDQQYATWLTNKSVASSLSATGYLYSLTYPRLDDCYLASVGPDRT
ncbi:MAG: phospholipase D-like domain-containing protein [Polyangiaceae bacterium]